MFGFNIFVIALLVLFIAVIGAGVKILPRATTIRSSASAAIRAHSGPGLP